jgi:imidazolonepropionase-like amidohydrolase
VGKSLPQGELGELTAGAAADLVLVEGDPLDDIGVLANSSNIKMVIKHGLLAKVGAACSCTWASSVNHRAQRR